MHRHMTRRCMTHRPHAEGMLYGAAPALPTPCKAATAEFNNIAGGVDVHQQVAERCLGPDQQAPVG